MPRKFDTRVQAERQAIVAINTRIPTSRGLAGLPQREIDRWRSEVDWLAIGLAEEDVIRQLSIIREICQTMADQSRGVFAEVEFDLESASAALECLRRVLDGFKREEKTAPPAEHAGTPR